MTVFNPGKINPSLDFDQVKLFDIQKLRVKHVGQE